MKSNTFNIAVLFVTLLSSCGSKEEVQREPSNIVAAEMAMAPMKSKVKFLPSKYEEDKVYDSGNASEDVYIESEKASDNVKSGTSSNKKQADKKKIIKDGNISIKADDIGNSKKKIDEILKKFSAYYEVEELLNNDAIVSYDLKIRIPSENFEKLVLTIENGKDEITSKSIQARDVTEEYIDLETRLNNKHEYLKRYKQLLAKAATVKDILAIEENIRTLEEEIESSEGRLKYLSDQVAYSTLDINLFKNKEFIYKPQEQDKFSERIKTSLSNGWTSVVDFILEMITIWPIVILTALIVFGIRWIVKKRKRKASN